jgi:hypothetical protein
MAEGVNPVDERRKARAEEKRTQVRYAVALSARAGSPPRRSKHSQNRTA